MMGCYASKILVFETAHDFVTVCDKQIANIETGSIMNTRMIDSAKENVPDALSSVERKA